MLPLAVLAWEAFWKVTLIAPWVASEARKALMVRNWTLVWDAIRFTPDTSPPQPSGIWDSTISLTMACYAAYWVVQW